MTDGSLRPAWSEQFTEAAIQQLIASGPIAELTPEWAYGGSTGQGIRVAVVDSGVEYDHPALGDCVRGGVVVEYDPEGENSVRIEPDDHPADLFADCRIAIDELCRPALHVLGNVHCRAALSEISFRHHAPFQRMHFTAR